MRYYPYVNRRNKFFIPFVFLAPLSLTCIFFFVLENYVLGILIFLAFAIPATFFLLMSIYYNSYVLIFNDDTIVFHHVFMKKDVEIVVDDNLVINLPNAKLRDSKRLQMIFNRNDQSLLFPTTKDIVFTLIGNYPSNVSFYERARGLYKRDPKSKKRRIAFIIVTGVVCGILELATIISPLFVLAFSQATNYFSDQQRMVDYAYIDGYKTVFYDYHELAFKTTFTSYVGRWGDYYGKKDADVTGSYIVDGDYIYYAISYIEKNEDTYSIEFYKQPTIKGEDSVFITIIKNVSVTRPLSFSGFDEMMHFYVAPGHYIFSFDFSSETQVDCGLNDDAIIETNYYKNHGFERQSVVQSNGLLQLENGDNTVQINVKKELPVISKRLKNHLYKPKSVTRLNDVSFIIYVAEYNDYDICLRYDWGENKLSYANSYWNHLGLSGSNPSFIPVLNPLQNNN